MCGFLSCSKDAEEDVFVSASEEDIEMFDSISEDVASFLENNVDASYEEMQRYLEKYSSQVSSVVEDSFLYITTSGGLEIQVDKFGLSKMEESTGNIDTDDFNNLVTTVDKSLGIIDDTGTRSVTENKKAREANSITRGTRNDERVLNSRKILLWAPWDELDIYDFQRTIHAIAQAYRLDFNQERDEYIGSVCSLESMKTFSDYDLVVLVCHGNSRGQLVVPYNKKWKERIGKGARVGDFYLNNGNKYEKAVVLDKDMTACLPKNMSKTVLWTAMCYAFSDKSAIKNAVLKADAADFIGATSKVGKNEVLPRLNGFAVRFYRGASTAEAFYPETPRKTYYKYELKSGIKGLYCKGDIDNVYYQYPLCLPAKGSMMRGCQTGSRNITRNANHATRTTTNEDAGFWIKNTETGIETTIPFSESSKVSYKAYSFENIKSYIYECKTDDFEEGNYEYRTYERINGETVYSDETFELEKTNNYILTLNFHYKSTTTEKNGQIDKVVKEGDFSWVIRKSDGRYSIVTLKYDPFFYSNYATDLEKLNFERIYDSHGGIEKCNCILDGDGFTLTLTRKLTSDNYSYNENNIVNINNMDTTPTVVRSYYCWEKLLYLVTEVNVDFSLTGWERNQVK